MGEATRNSPVCSDPAKGGSVLVWVDPISQRQDRRQLDALLRDVAFRGVWVSTHPDVIWKMG